MGMLEADRNNGDMDTNNLYYYSKSYKMGVRADAKSEVRSSSTKSSKGK